MAACEHVENGATLVIQSTFITSLITSAVVARLHVGDQIAEFFRH